MERKMVMTKETAKAKATATMSKDVFRRRLRCVESSFPFRWLAIFLDFRSYFFNCVGHPSPSPSLFG